MSDVIEAEATEVEGEHELAVAPPTPGTLFRTDDPVTVAKRATEVANALKDILKSQNLTSRISGREHVRVEGWQTLGAMLGVTPICIWTREIDKGWEARVEARTLDGRVIGAAEAMCTRDERTWKTRDDYALRSMAQTRATSKALGSPLRFIVTLAGYDGTPAEEIVEPARPDTAAVPPPEKLTDAQQAEVMDAIMRCREKGMTLDALAGLMGANGIDRPEKASIQSVRARVSEITPKQAIALWQELEKWTP